MKVKELIELLAACDAEAEVSMMVQPHYPHEHRVSGVALREDCCGDEGETERSRESGTAPHDVLLVEGSWIRYGNRAAWNAARTRPR